MVSKYRAVRTNGYASKREAAYATTLRALEKAGEIAQLQEQVSFELVPRDELGRAVRYLADFRYWDNRSAKWVICDVKGYRTDVYKLKRRLMWKVHGIIVEEV